MSLSGCKLELSRAHTLCAQPLLSLYLEILANLNLVVWYGIAVYNYNVNKIVCDHP